MPEVAFAGKSNVGKSSLINALMNRKSYARISDGRMLIAKPCKRRVNPKHSENRVDDTFLCKHPLPRRIHMNTTTTTTTAAAKRSSTLYMVELAMMIAIILLMSFTPLGYLRTPGLSITLLQLRLFVVANDESGAALLDVDALRAQFKKKFLVLHNHY